MIVEIMSDEKHHQKEELHRLKEEHRHRDEEVYLLDGSMWMKNETQRDEISVRNTDCHIIRGTVRFDEIEDRLLQEAVHHLQKFAGYLQFLNIVEVLVHTLVHHLQYTVEVVTVHRQSMNKHIHEEPHQGRLIMIVMIDIHRRSEKWNHQIMDINQILQ